MSFHRRALHRNIAAVLLALSVAVPASAQLPRSAPLANIAADISAIRIDNFGRVNEHYYRGALPEGRDFSDLAAVGVKTLVDLTDDDGDANEKAAAEKLGMNFFKIPMSTRVQPTATELESFLKIVNNPANQPVYVHCVGGRHRTGVMTAVYRMTQEGWTPDRAFQEMKKYKFGADFLHPEFKKFVYAFHQESRPTTPTNTVLATTVIN